MWQQIGRNERTTLSFLLTLGLLYGCVLGAGFYVARLVNTLGGNASIAGALMILSLLPVVAVAMAGRKIYRRWTAPQMLRAGLACHAAQLLLLATANSLALLVPAMLLSGFGFAFTFVNLLNGTTAVTPKAFYAQGIAYLTIATQLGIGLSSVIAAFVEPRLGTNGVFWVPLALALTALCFVNWVPVTPAAAAPVTPTIAAPAAKSRLLEVFILMGALGLAFGLPLQYVPMWLGSAPELGFSPAYFLTTSFFTIMLTRIFFSHWLGGNREFHVAAACFGILALAISVLGQAGTPLQFALCAVAYGGAYSLLYPSCMAYLIAKASPENRSAWSSWVMLGYEVGARLLPAGFGVVADHHGFSWTFLLLGLVIGVVGAWHISRRLLLLRELQPSHP